MDKQTDFDYKFQEVLEHSGELKALVKRSGPRTTAHDIYLTEDDAWKLDCAFNDAALGVGKKTGTFKFEANKQHKRLIDSWKSLRQSVISIQAAKAKEEIPRTAPTDFTKLDSSAYGI